MVDSMRLRFMAQTNETTAGLFLLPVY